MKKRILLFISIIASALTAQAQNYQMKVVKNDGKVETFATKDVKEVLLNVWRMKNTNRKNRNSLKSPEPNGRKAT